jgi:hypothetical protein
MLTTKRAQRHPPNVNWLVMTLIIIGVIVNRCNSNNVRKMSDGPKTLLLLEFPVQAHKRNIRTFWLTMSASDTRGLPSVRVPVLSNMIDVTCGQDSKNALGTLALPKMQTSPHIKYILKNHLTEMHFGDRHKSYVQSTTYCVTYIRHSVAYRMRTQHIFQIAVTLLVI